MLANLPPNAAELWPHPQMYIALRGWALEKLMEHIFTQENWNDMRSWGAKKLAQYLRDVSANGAGDRISRRFLEEHPATALWLAHCLRILFTALKVEWEVRWVTRGPLLPVLSLPDATQVGMGEPDFLFYSDKLGGFVAVEIKTGAVRNHPKDLTIARYLTGVSLWLKRHKPAGKLLGVVWISFSTARRVRRSNKHLPRRVPVYHRTFIRFNEERSSSYLTRRFGQRLSDDEVWYWPTGMGPYRKRGVRPPAIQAVG